jgi:hypothetical protein
MMAHALGFDEAMTKIDSGTRARDHIHTQVARRRSGKAKKSPRPARRKSPMFMNRTERAVAWMLSLLRKLAT